MLSPQPNKVDWADVIMAADAEKEIFSNMRIVTARSEFISKAQELAIDESYKTNNIDEYNINTITLDIIKSGEVKVYESAVVYEDGIFVCLDVDIIDDDAVWKALDLVYLAVSNDGEWISDLPLTFDTNNISFDFNIYA
jgi:hypothetical protein